MSAPALEKRKLTPAEPIPLRQGARAPGLEQARDPGHGMSHDTQPFPPTTVVLTDGEKQRLEGAAIKALPVEERKSLLREHLADLQEDIRRLRALHEEQRQILQKALQDATPAPEPGRDPGRSMLRYFRVRASGSPPSQAPLRTLVWLLLLLNLSFGVSLWLMWRGCRP